MSTPTITDLAIAEIEKEAIALHPVYSIDLLPIHVLGLIARLRAAERDASKFREIVSAVVREIPRRSMSRGNAPGHGHSIPGVWDSDNGKLSGTECAWCKAWHLASEAAEAEEKP